MLTDATVYATIAVSDLAEAKEFYGGILGLIQIDDNPEGVMYVCGEGKLFVYPSETAGTNAATCAAWEVEDVQMCVDDLKSRGVAFESYDIPGAVTESDITIMGPKQVAWFKDPDGNILSVAN
jgi:catechol 2,3-dioxygenase-like lactoylglutathione lyase family enzyme